ncbi:hypothetical protein SO802_029086 [Lithocarpus litseifolius]|uniref:SMC hinge domain-containing protein n=1 Tax=Lithocarpus litseifolius TaxID=425828 RepID=A0AAW2BUK4_9ROSI
MVTPSSLCECESFDKLKRECTRDEQLDLDLLTLRVLKDLIQFHPENPSLPLTSEEKKLQYRFKPTWGSFQRKRSNVGSSKTHTRYQLPNLNVKRKRFSQPTGIATEEDQIEEKPPKKPKLNPALPRSNPSPKLPQNFQNMMDTMGGTQLVLVIQKPLTKTDLNRHNARLSMPLSQINGSFLREAEREYLDQQQAMEVPFMEASGKVNKIVLRQWDMPKESGKKSSCYVLIKSWNEVVEKNDLGRKLKQVIQIWSFRVAVVGPNGSGKSNVIDAMLFVFRTQAKQCIGFICFAFGGFCCRGLNAQRAFEDAQKQEDVILGKLKTKTASIADIQTDIEKKKLEVLGARKVEQECIKEQDALIPIEQAARQKVAELKSILDTDKSQGSVLKANLQAKESNRIEGIYGRMGDLGAIDSKYDVAISTACPGLDYIVVETTGAAQACVELLRRENLGVATFMILEKQVEFLPKLKEKISTPEGVPRLFDLIKVQDERMKPAFFAALGNTVVAKDLDQATRIAYSGNKEFQRVVTLDGALFETSGTMSGGGSKPHGGKMGTSI